MDRKRLEGIDRDWLRGKRALLAEDNLTNQIVAAQMLEALGVEVEIAKDGVEALGMIAPRFDLFLIDIEMPRVSGLDVIRAIREADPPMRHAPVVAVSAYALREHREKIREAGADGLISKPLISIDQFGRDIAAFSRRGEEETPCPRGAPAGVDGAAAGERPLVDETVYAVLAETLGPEAMLELLTKLGVDLARTAEAAGRGVREGDRQAVAGATHILISLTGTVGARRAEELSQRLNRAAHDERDDMAPINHALQAEIARLRRFVGERLEASLQG